LAVAFIIFYCCC